jgi:hypothetical protein
MALVIAVLLNVLTYLAIFSGYLSRMGTYRELRLGMTRQAAVETLERNHIGCGSAYPRETPPLGCTFWDFWREYNIGFSPGTNGRLEIKSFGYRRRSTSIARLIRWLAK